MPIYEFKLDDDSIVEEFFHAGEAPRIGESVRLECGELGRRVPSQPLSSMVRRDVSFTCLQAARKWTGDGPDPAPRRNEKGQPVLHSRKEAIEFGRATGMKYDEL